MILKTLMMIVFIILIVYYNISFIKDYIRAVKNNNKIDYSFLKSNLYNILLTENFEKCDIFSRIKKLFSF